MISLEIITQHNLSEHCVLEYFGTLYEIISQFSCTGEEILRRNGFRSRAWVESLFAIAAEHRCFANVNCPQGLPFGAIRPLITPELVAVFCLASDLMEATFYERLLAEQYQQLSCQQSNSNQQLIKGLRVARRKFNRQKLKYMDLAYGPHRESYIDEAFDVCSKVAENRLQRDIWFSTEIMPIVFQVCPRGENVTDLAPVDKLCRKYIHYFTICTEVAN